MATAEDIAPFGLVTLADAACFPGLELFYRSVEESWPLPLACFDAGLTDAQKRIAGNYPLLRILPLPATELVAGAEAAFRDAPAMRKPNKRVWPLWICPDLIAAAPYRQVFWMDCDIVVLRNLRDLLPCLRRDRSSHPKSTRRRPRRTSPSFIHFSRSKAVLTRANQGSMRASRAGTSSAMRRCSPPTGMRRCRPARRLQFARRSPGTIKAR